MLLPVLHLTQNPRFLRHRAAVRLLDIQARKRTAHDFDGRLHRTTDTVEHRGDESARDASPALRIPILLKFALDATTTDLKVPSVAPFLFRGTHRSGRLGRNRRPRSSCRDRCSARRCPGLGVDQPPVSGSARFAPARSGPAPTGPGREGRTTLPPHTAPLSIPLPTLADRALRPWVERMSAPLHS
jgi:hypothetical protein